MPSWEAERRERRRQKKKRATDRDGRTGKRKRRKNQGHWNLWAFNSFVRSASNEKKSCLLIRNKIIIIKKSRSVDGMRHIVDIYIKKETILLCIKFNKPYALRSSNVSCSYSCTADSLIHGFLMRFTSSCAEYIKKELLIYF